MNEKEEGTPVVFLITEGWVGWFCERYGWNLPQHGGDDQDMITLHIRADFDVQDCEFFICSKSAKGSTLRDAVESDFEKSAGGRDEP